MIEGVAGVVIWTSELMKMVEFYQGKLGLEPHSIKPDFVSFKWGQMRLGLGIHGQVTGASKDPFRVMVNFGVDDIESEYSRLTSQGIIFIRKPEKEHWGGRIATFSDPDGNILQLMQFEA